MSDIWKDAVQDSIVLHIPHASNVLPLGKENYLPTLKKDLELSTDWDTDKIFDLPYTTVKSKYSRVFCDVERFEEDPMDKVGRGFFYTHSVDGLPLRKSDVDYRESYAYYVEYHENFTRVIEEKVENIGIAVIIDCHSFNDEPLSFEESKTPRPDFCIGTDDYHTPKFLVDNIVNQLSGLGYYVGINTPYAGTIAPLEFYKKDKRVYSVMIEVNKRLYRNPEDVTKLNLIFKNILGSFI